MKEIQISLDNIYMVYSNLNSTIFYKESGTIDNEDIGHESTLYEMELFNKQIIICFGKIKHTFIQRNVVYVPIYLVVHHKTKQQIGLLEFNKDETLGLFDDDNEIDLSKILQPILFGFVDEEYIDRSGSNSLNMVKLQQSVENNTIEDSVENIEINIEDSDDEDDIHSVKVNSSKLSGEMKKASQILEKGIFSIDPKIKRLNPLVEETQEIANAIKENYETSHKNNWIQEYMKNEYYGIHDVESNGDCFFAVIRDAFQQIGYKTSVAKLRAIVAKEVTDEVFQNHRILYNDLKGTINEYNKELKSIKTNIEETLSKRAKKAIDKSELNIILQETDGLKQKHKEIMRNKQAAQSMIDEDLGNLQAIDSLDKFREFIQTSGFWADSWAISILEYNLKVKFILLSERSFLDNDLYNVLLCGEVYTKIQDEGKFEPKHYIMTAFSGDHYRLITYKNKRLFDFFEIPYHIKALITNKCLESNSGAFGVIPEIKNMKLKMGLDEEDEIVEDLENSSIYNKDVVFVFHRNSSGSLKPGMAKNVKETIPSDKRSDYISLSKIKDWRRKLDDTWTEAPFDINGKKWISVEHYYQSSKFQLHNPDFANLFSLNSNESAIAKDVDLAISAGSKSGRATGKAKSKVKGDTLLRPKGIEIDPQFYGERSQQERIKGLRGKFSNEDMKKILLATGDSKLVQYKHGSNGETDHMLMTIRSELKGSI